MSSSSTISCKRKVVCVFSLVGVLPPFSWPYITWAEESRSFEEEEMKERTRRRRASEVHYGAVSVIKWRRCRGRAEGPEFPELDVGGLSALNPSPSQPLSFWGANRDTCFFKVKSYGAHVFEHLRKCGLWNETDSNAGKHFSSIGSFNLSIQVGSLKNFQHLLNNVFMTKRQRKRTWVIAEILNVIQPRYCT